MKYGTFLTFLFTISLIAAALALPARSNAPDRSFRAEIGVQKSRCALFIYDKHTKHRTLAWVGAAKSVDHGVEYGKERIAKLQWSQHLNGQDSRLLLVVTELQRYSDVYDPHAVYMFSAREPRLRWTKVFGRRWEEVIGWSPDSSLITTVIHPAGSAEDKGDAALVIDSANGAERKRIYVAELTNRGVSSTIGIASAQFIGKDVIKLSLYKNNDKKLGSYLWHFRD